MDAPELDLLPLVAAAWSLSDERLVEVPRQAWERPRRGADRLVALLTDRWPRVHEAVARRAVDAALRAWRMPGDRLGALAGALFGAGTGVHRVHQPAWEMLGPLVDLDALACWRLRHTTSPRSDWPCFPPPHVDHLRLPQQLAETHLHLGGAVPIPVLWAVAISHQVPPDQVFAEAAELDSRWPEALSEAATCLLELAGAQRAGSSVAPDSEQIRQTMERAHDAAVDLDLEPAARWPFGGRRGTRPERPLQAVLGPERRLLLRAMAAQSAQQLSQPLLRYLALKFAFQQSLVQLPGPGGLARFARAWAGRRGYSASSPGRSPNQRRLGLLAERASAAIVVDGFLEQVEARAPAGLVQAGDLRLELRVTPGRGPRALVDHLRAWLGGVRDALTAREPAPPLRAGFVFHLAKSDVRGHAARLSAAEQVEGLLALAGVHAELRPFLLGLDAAGEEALAGPRVFADAYRMAARALPDGGRLGRTFHVGEDPESQITGLRHVHECLTLLQLTRGDRLGHAQVLDREPAQVYSGAQCWARLGAHTLDLLWAHDQLARAVAPEAQRLRRMVLRDLWRLSRLFASERGDRATSPDAGHLLACWVPLSQAAQDPVLTKDEVLDRLGVPDGLRERTIPLFDVPAGGWSHAGWVELVTWLRDHVTELVRAEGLVVETCPTSNQVIGDVPRVGLLPYLRPRPDNRSLPVYSVNTDDPGMFHTSLLGELDRVHLARVAEGDRAEDVGAWLEQLRQNGRRSSFLRDDSPSGEFLVRTIEAALKGHVAVPPARESGSADDSARASPPPGPDLFIIHAGPDSDVAHALHAELDKLQIRAFLDISDISFSEPWHETIQRAIERSRAFLVLISRHTLQAWYVQDELKRAIDRCRSREAQVPLLRIDVLDGAPALAAEHIPYGLAHEPTIATIRRGEEVVAAAHATEGQLKGGPQPSHYLSPSPPPPAVSG